VSIYDSNFNYSNSRFTYSNNPQKIAYIPPPGILQYDYRIITDINDEMPDFLVNKILAGPGITITQGCLPTGEQVLYINAVPGSQITQIFTVNVNSPSVDGEIASYDTFTQTPLAGSFVQVFVNGLAVYVANGPAEAGLIPVISPCFFASPGSPEIIRHQGQIQAGDLLHWNGSFAGFQLEEDDIINVIYYV